jgi:hypothetical protein
MRVCSTGAPASTTMRPDEESREASLTHEDVASILRICSPDGLLVGGQALGLWVDQLGVQRPAIFVASITTDADFLGSAQLARTLGRGIGWKTWVASLDDFSPRIAKVTHLEPDGAIKQVDFLSGVVGLNTIDVRRRAIRLEMSGIGPVTIMHPVDVLASRIANLQVLPAKRTPAGFAQARLAIDMVAAFIREQIKSRGARAGLTLLERVVGIAEDHSGLLVFVLYGIDVLKAAPMDAFLETPELHSGRWPQVLAEVGRQRASLAKLANRVSDSRPQKAKPGKPKPTARKKSVARARARAKSGDGAGRRR